MNKIALIKAKKILITLLNSVGIVDIIDNLKEEYISINNSRPLKYEDLIKAYEKDHQLKWIVIQYTIAGDMVKDIQRIATVDWYKKP